jgi:hypothetical protein
MRVFCSERNCTSSDGFKTRKSFQYHWRKFHRQDKQDKNITTPEPLTETPNIKPCINENHIAAMHPGEKESLDNVYVEPIEPLVEDKTTVHHLNPTNLKEADFQRCRVSPEGKISVFDAIAHFCGCDKKQARRKSRELTDGKTSKPEVQGVALPYHHFQGERQRPTPVATFSNLLTILSQLPGTQARALRGVQSHIANRVLGGDRAVIPLILDSADNKEKTHTMMTTSITPHQLMVDDKAILLHAELARQHVDAAITQLQVNAERRKSGMTHTLKRRIDEVGVTLDTDTRMLTSNVASREDGTLVAASRWVDVMDAVDLVIPALDTEPWDEASIYFIRVVGTTLVKVGYTHNLRHRLSTLQTANSQELQVEFQFLTPHFRRYERDLHVFLTAKDKRVRGEWFRIERGTNYFQLIAGSCELQTSTSQI